MSQSRMSKVPLGISLVFWGLELTALAILLMFVVPFIGARNFVFMMRIVMLLARMLLVASVMSVLGKVLCLTAPKAMRGKGIIYVCVGFDLVSLFIGLAEEVTTVPAMLSNFKSTFSIIGFVLFVIFLRKLAEFIHRRVLAGKAGQLLKLCVLFVVFVILAAISALKFPTGALVFMFMALITGLVSLIQYSRLLLAIKKVLKTV